LIFLHIAEMDNMKSPFFKKTTFWNH